MTIQGGHNMLGLTRTPVRITGVKKFEVLHGRLVGHEATAYSGDNQAADLLGPLLRLSEEAQACSAKCYIVADEVTFEPISPSEVTEKVLL